MPFECAVVGCHRNRVGRGWCLNHYKKWQRAGTPNRPTLADRFFASVGPGPGDCWLWTGNVTVVPDGFQYGAFSIKRQLVGAHRWAYEYLRAEIPAGLVLDHLCRNTLCVNPWHLDPVPQRINVLRGTGPSARNAVATHCIHGHEFTPENIYRPPKRPDRRYCRTCLRVRAQERGRRQVGQGIGR